jgi:hypothetical protein
MVTQQGRVKVMKKKDESSKVQVFKLFLSFNCPLKELLPIPFIP